MILLKTFAILPLSSKILLVSKRRISASPFACLLEKYGLEVDQSGLELFFVSRLSKKLFLQLFFSVRIKLCRFLYWIRSFFLLRFHSFDF